MEETTLTALLKKAASDFPDSTAVSASGEFALTHGRLQELVDHAAALLAASGVGVGAGDVVALTFPDTVEFVILFLAVIRCRATAAPLNPAYTAEKFELCFSDLEAKLLLTPQEGNQPAQSAASKLNIPHLTAKLPSADSKITLSSTDIEPDLYSMSKVVNVPSDVALFSGFMRLTQHQLALKVQFDKCRLTELDSTATVSPLFRYYSLVPGLLSYLAAGASVALQVATASSRFSADLIPENATCDTADNVAPLRNRSKGASPYQSNDMPEASNAPNTTKENKTKIERVAEEGGRSGDNVEVDLNCIVPRKFSYKEVETATNDFAEVGILGEGGFGFVYEGYIGEDRRHVAVKRIKSNSRQGIKEYISEVNTLSELRHRNVMQLIGYSHDANKFLLVYPFMRQGSLEHHLFNGRTLLRWEWRYDIARGTALGLHYLHRECDQCVLHRDIKSSNIMLDENFNPKLGDFGLARQVDHASEPNTSRVMGTWGYLDPEYFRTGKATKESDVYSFGVVLLEIGSGRKAVEEARDPQNLVEWVWKQYGRGKLLDAVDSRLGKIFDKKQAKALMIAGLWCAHPTACYRPSIEAAMAVLNLNAEPPKLPPKMPQSQHIIELKVSFGCFGR